MEYGSCSGCYWEGKCSFNTPDGCYESDKAIRFEEITAYKSGLNERQCNYRKVVYDIFENNQ